MKNIIVIAYQLSPFKGSEYSVAWDYVTNMSVNNRITVLYGTSGLYHDIGNTEEVDTYVKEHPLENVTYISVKPSFKPHNYDYSTQGIYLFYKEYKEWHKDVYQVVMSLLSKEKYDLIHFLGPIGYREPGFLYDLPVPYIWGPIGGFGGVKLRLLRETYSFSYACHYIIKRAFNSIEQLTLRRVRKALKYSDVVLCCTSEYMKTIQTMVGKKHHSIIRYRAENCIKKFYDVNLDKYSNEVLHFVFVGRIDALKGLSLVIKALAQIDQELPIIVDVVGDGYMKNKMQGLAKEYNVEHYIKFHGAVPRETVFQMMGDSHLLVIPSLFEGNPTTQWEAMSVGTPIMALDHCGMHDVVDDEVGFPIQVNSIPKIISSIARVFEEIAADPLILKAKAERIMTSREKYSWERRKAFFEEMYELAISNYKNR